jgi:hypothetical protein
MPREFIARRRGRYIKATPTSEASRFGSGAVSDAAPPGATLAPKLAFQKS